MSTAETDPNETGYGSFLKYTGFNIHTIHHLFPTIDHDHLQKADKVLREVCKEKGIKLFENDFLTCNRKIYRLYTKREPFIFKTDE